jgi:hypothetical protein
VVSAAAGSPGPLLLLVAQSQGSNATLLTQLAWPSPNATTCSSSSRSHRHCQRVGGCTHT